MTRSEFEAIGCIEDLYQVCVEYGLSAMEDVVDRDYMNELVIDYLQNVSRSDDWTDIRDWLNEIDTYYDWFKFNGGIEFDAISESDLEYLMDDVRSEMERDRYFDDEDDDDEDTWDNDTYMEPDLDWLPEESNTTDAVLWFTAVARAAEGGAEVCT